MQRLQTFFYKNKLLSFLFFVTVATSLFYGVNFQAVDWKVIFSLFALMLVIKNLENHHVLDKLASSIVAASATQRKLLRNLLLLTFFSSMILTNDVAILVLLPVYLRICKQSESKMDYVWGSILLIVSANLGSAFFPFGNPQNLFLFSYYSIRISTFFSWSSVLAVLSIVLLFFCHLKEKKTPLAVNIKLDTFALDWKKVSFLFFVFLVIILGILDVFPYYPAITVSTLLLLLFDTKQVKKVDFSLLVTFLFFFLAIGNISKIPILIAFLQASLGSKYAVLGLSASFSQLISNVPAAILFSSFTTDAKALYLGVSLGGLGTLIASLANLIGFKVFLLYYPNERKSFFRVFTISNFIFLLFLLGLFLFIL